MAQNRNIRMNPDPNDWILSANTDLSSDEGENRIQLSNSFNNLNNHPHITRRIHSSPERQLNTILIEEHDGNESRDDETFRTIQEGIISEDESSEPVKPLNQSGQRQQSQQQISDRTPRLYNFLDRIQIREPQDQTSWQRVALDYKNQLENVIQMVNNAKEDIRALSNELQTQITFQNDYEKDMEGYINNLKDKYIRKITNLRRLLNNTQPQNQTNENKNEDKVDFEFLYNRAIVDLQDRMRENEREISEKNRLINSLRERLFVIQYSTNKSRNVQESTRRQSNFSEFFNRKNVSIAPLEIQNNNRSLFNNDEFNITRCARPYNNSNTINHNDSNMLNTYNTIQSNHNNDNNNNFINHNNSNNNRTTNSNNNEDNNSDEEIKIKKESRIIEKFCKLKVQACHGKSLEEITTWLFLCEEHFKMLHVPEHLKLNCVVNCLKEMPMHLFKRMKEDNENVTWIEFKQALESQFKTANINLQIRQELRNLKQKGSLKEYTRQFTLLINQGNNWGNIEKVDHFINGLRKDLQIEVNKQTPQTLESAIQIAANMEYAINPSPILVENKNFNKSIQRNSFNKTNLQTRTFYKSNNNSQIPNKKEVVCYKCNLKGHYATECLKNPKNQEKNTTNNNAKQQNKQNKQKSDFKVLLANKTQSINLLSDTSDSETEDEEVITALIF